jgi:hypothetical protein
MADKIKLWFDAEADFLEVRPTRLGTKSKLRMML